MAVFGNRFRAPVVREQKKPPTEPVDYPFVIMAGMPWRLDLPPEGSNAVLSPAQVLTSTSAPPNSWILASILSNALFKVW
jgi:hypothetical protein